MLLAACEDATTKDSWRTVNPGTARYLAYLAEQGYDLADVERRACDQDPADHAPGTEGSDHGGRD